MRAGCACKGLTVWPDDVRPPTRTPETAVAEQDTDCHEDHGSADNEDADQQQCHQPILLLQKSLEGGSHTTYENVVVFTNQKIGGQSKVFGQVETLGAQN